jgi:DNA replication and repair protein RecF
VEHNFYPIWHRYQAALKQRNMALRQSSSKELIQIWDKELLEVGNILNSMRSIYINELQQLLHQYIHPVLGQLDITIQYQPGWAKESSFEEAIKYSLDKDRERGFTGVGPQRADISVKVDGVLANERISRGQQKILVTCLLLAQAALYNTKTAKKCILLIDDVAAELDPENRNRLLQVLQGMHVQMFLTSIEKGTLLPMRDLCSTSRMFHVEHGKLTDVV